MAWAVPGYATSPPPPASWAPAAWGGGPTQGGPGGLGYNPQVPSPGTTAQQAIGANIGNLGGLYGLAGGVNAFQQRQAAGGLQTNLPGYQGLIGQSSANIGQELQGQVPSDVVTEILQGAAERGIMTGSPGSANANAAYLRALGLTSLGQMQTGEQNLTAAIGRTPQAPLMNLTPFMPGAGEFQQAGAANAIYGAAPNPTAVAGANLGAAYGGLAAGRGSVGAPTMPTFGGGWGGAPMTSTGATGTNIGGVTYGEGQNPSTAFSNWNDWYSSIFPGGTTTGTGGFNPQDVTGQGLGPLESSQGYSQDLLSQPDLSSLYG